jgi:hypothetical protein
MLPVRLPRKKPRKNTPVEFCPAFGEIFELNQYFSAFLKSVPVVLQ